MLRRHLCIAALNAALGANVVGVQSADACSTLPPCTAITPYATDNEAINALAKPATVARGAYTLARSTAASSVPLVEKALLADYLVSSIFAGQEGVRCAMPAILRALAENPLGRPVLVTLIKSTVWQESSKPESFQRPQALLHASGAIRPPPPELVAYWNQHANPDDGWVNVTVMALAENGSDEAIALFYELLRDPKHDVERRMSWLHNSNFIAHRHERAMLGMAARLLTRVPPALKTAIAEVVFDYRQRWYGTCTGPTPPTVDKYTPEARKLVRLVAALARRNSPDKQLDAAITKMISAFDAKP